MRVYLFSEFVLGVLKAGKRNRPNNAEKTSESLSSFKIDQYFK
jgi:hypothetical protein